MTLPLVEQVQNRLATDRLGQSMRGYETIDSTNAKAADWAHAGAPEGSVVVAEYQSAGRGRQGRTWTAKKGQNLMFSVVFRPRTEAERLGLLVVAASVAVAETIDEVVAPHTTALKWPNDVLLEGRKTCGMLLESSIPGPEEVSVVVLGVGLNVNQTAFPDELTDTATSLRLTTGRTVPRVPLFSRLLQQLERRYDGVEAGTDRPIRAAFEDRLEGLNKQATFRSTETGRTMTGTVRGITETGALRLETEDGMERIHAGEVTSRR